MAECAICGEATTGELCRKHRHEQMRLAAAKDARERDSEVLAIMAEPGMNPSRMAARIGISRVAARHRVLNAKRRAALLAETAA